MENTKNAVHKAAQQGFEKEAQAYARGRPDYPAALSAWLAQALGLGPGREVADVGAGTGKFTALLATTGATVVGVEPVDAMRAKIDALQLPTVAMAALTVGVGTDSAKTLPDKLQRHGVELFEMPGNHPAQTTPPLVQGCAAWLLGRVIPEPHIQHAYDVFIGEVMAARPDDRVFRNGHWEFDTAPDALRTLHYVAGGQFYATGASVKV